jgi:putative lipoprotein
MATQPAAAQPAYVPPGARPYDSYKLGVNARNTDTGLQLTQVLPNSLAQRFGLEAGDVIVTVAGFQVGYVGGRLVDMTDELARRVDAQGRVTLLVRNHRNGQLVNIPLQFDPALQATRVITGRIGTQNHAPVSPSAILSVRLLDITRPEWTDVVIAEQLISDPQRFPVGYRLEVSPRRIKAGHRYALVARLTDRGHVALQTPSPVRTLLAEGGSRVDLVLQPSVALPPSQPSPYDQITQLFLTLLGRQPTPRELSTWQQHLDRGGSVTDVRVSILSSSEFYDRFGNDPQQYLAGVYSAVYGTPPTPQQKQQMGQKLLTQGGVRHRFVEDLLSQASP